MYWLRGGVGASCTYVAGNICPLYTQIIATLDMIRTPSWSKEKQIQSGSAPHSSANNIWNASVKKRQPVHRIEPNTHT